MNKNIKSVLKPIKIPVEFIKMETQASNHIYLLKFTIYLNKNKVLF